MTTLPLAKLVPSDLNVRVSATSDESIAALAENIAANGLLQSLVVVPQGKNFAVVAGARRLAALKLLAADKRLPKGFEVNVLITTAAEATEQSLSENYMREKMTPCDIYAAFASIPLATDTELAKRFGLSVDAVRRTKRLGNLAAPIFNDYAAGKISDQSAQAYAATADTALQLRVYELLQELPNHERGAHTIRRHLGLGDRNLEQKLRFVTVAAYEAAGGVFERDLFNTHDEAAGRISDAALLEELYVKAVTAALTIPGATIAFERPDYRLSINPTYGELSDEDKITLVELEAELAEIEEDESEEAESRAIELNKLINALEDKIPEVYPEGDKIAVPRFDYTGALSFDVYRVEAPVAEGSEDPKGEDARASDAGQEAGRPALTIRAEDHIKAERKQLLVKAAADDDGREGTIRFLFVQAMAYAKSFGLGGIRHLSTGDRTPLRFIDEPWFKEQDFDLFLGTSEAHRGAVANDLLRALFEPVPIGADTFAVREFGAAVDEGGRDYWTPDAEFFDLFKKQQLVDMLHAIDPEQAAMLVNMKVADAKARALKLVTQPKDIGGVTDEVAARALAWVPDFLRFTPTPVADSVEVQAELEDA